MSTASISSFGSNGMPRGRAKACNACRQVKLRCDAKDRGPSPCSRCKAQGLDCRMDPSFKRVPARKQLEEVSNRLNNLQRSLGLDQNPHIPPSASLQDYMRHSQRPDDFQRSQARQADFGRVSSEPSTPDSHPPPKMDKFLILEDVNEQGSWTLGDVTVDADTVRVLFKHFDETHWYHAPWLEPCTSLHAYYQTSELMFWTVVLTSCFLFNEYDDVHYQLLSHHRALLSAKMLGERVSLKTIHAMLIMCTWSYPVSSQYDDLTWMLCGAAINMAMMMGLHQPGHIHEYGHERKRNPGSTYIRNTTWLACFIISTGVSSWLGMPPPLSAASHIETITTLCKDSSIPKSFRARADIQKQVVQLITSLDSKLDFRTRYSLIKIYEKDFDRVQSTYEDVWNDDLEIEWLGAKLNLFGIAFVSHGPSPGSIETESPAMAAREVLQRGLAAAVGILDTVSHMKLPHTHRGENKSESPDYVYQLGFYPKNFFRVGAFANFFLLWFLAVDAQASESDKELARTYVTFTYQLLLSFKNSPEHLRAGKAIEELARMPISSGKPSSLRVNSRLGASFMYSYTLDGTSESNPARRVIPTSSGDGTGDDAMQDMKFHRVLPPCSTTRGTPLTPHIEPKPEPPPAESRVPVQQPSPPMNQDQVFSNAFFQDGPMQNWDFPWAEWDPSVFNGLRMDVDMNQMPMAETGLM